MRNGVQLYRREARVNGFHLQIHVVVRLQSKAALQYHTDKIRGK
jgi:hypothetical protein